MNLVKWKIICFFRGFVTHEIYFFPVHSMKYYSYSWQKFEYPLYIKCIPLQCFRYFQKSGGLSHSTLDVNVIFKTVTLHGGPSHNTLAVNVLLRNVTLQISIFIWVVKVN